MESCPSAPRRRRYDPDRRERIAAAALRVVARDGIDGLTHRAVAREADVPLGSTSYHFADKDELLRSAVELAEAIHRKVLTEALERFSPQDDLPAAMASVVEQLTRRKHKDRMLEAELYLAARHRPELRPTSQRWVDDVYELIRRFTPDDVTASAVALAFEGMITRATVLDRRLPAAETEPVFRRVVAG